MKHKMACFLCMVPFCREIEEEEPPVCRNCYVELQSLPPIERMKICISIASAKEQAKTANSLSKIIKRFEWLCGEAESNWKAKIFREGAN